MAYCSVDGVAGDGGRGGGCGAVVRLVCGERMPYSVGGLIGGVGDEMNSEILSDMVLLDGLLADMRQAETYMLLATQHLAIEGLLRPSFPLQIFFANEPDVQIHILNNML